MQDKVPTPPDRFHLEDIEIGRAMPFGRISVSKEDIITFARSYDPQSMHLDEAAAKASIVGGLCASGFHSCAIMMRMLADDLLNDNWTSLGSPGIDECKWMKPLFPVGADRARPASGSARSPSGPRSALPRSSSRCSTKPATSS